VPFLGHVYVLNTIFGNDTARVTVSFFPGSPAQTSGPPEKCHEGDPADLDILLYVVDGEDRLESLSYEQIEELSEQLIPLCFERYDKERSERYADPDE
jgi:hypothetical protein